MATNGCIPLCFFDTTKTAFFFKELAAGVFEDAFTKTQNQNQVWMKSKENKFLIFSDEREFGFQNLTTEVQQSHPEEKFNIQLYRDSTIGTKGRAVMLYSCKDGIKMVVCCNDKGEIHPVQMEPPNEIKEDKHRAVFYREKIQSRYIFRSSLFPSKILGFQLINDALKLVLLTVESDETNENGFFSLDNK